MSSPNQNFPVAPLGKDATPAQAFERLHSIIALLRAPGGCPWDREQTHLTLRRHLIEEAYEVLAAIEEGDDSDLQEELGDLLMQPLMHAQVAADEGRFDVVAVLECISDKLVRRHPHVFGDVTVDDSGEVLRNWDAIKRQEKTDAGRAPSTSALGESPPALPALASALEVSKKAAKVGFEWPDIAGVFDKLREEIDELEQVLSAEPVATKQQRASEELGDLLFTVVNIARWNKVDPELALRDMVNRFRHRFYSMEETAQARDVDLKKLSPAEWEELWCEAKIGETRD